MIYFVQSSVGNPIKIGTTTNLVRRMTALESQHRRPFLVLGVLDGTYADERALHKKFSHLCVPSVGREWFRSDPELHEFIDAETREWDGEIEKADPTLILAYVGNPEVGEWLNALADEIPAPPSVVFDMALKTFAESVGFRPMPKRLGGKR